MDNEKWRVEQQSNEEEATCEKPNNVTISNGTVPCYDEIEEEDEFENFELETWNEDEVPSDDSCQWQADWDDDDFDDPFTVLLRSELSGETNN